MEQVRSLHMTAFKKPEGRRYLESLGIFRENSTKTDLTEIENMDLNGFISVRFEQMEEKLLFNSSI